MRKRGDKSQLQQQVRPVEHGSDLLHAAHGAPALPWLHECEDRQGHPGGGDSPGRALGLPVAACAGLHPEPPAEGEEDVQETASGLPGRSFKWRGWDATLLSFRVC